MKFIYLIALFSLTISTTSYAESLNPTNQAKYTLKGKPVTGSKIPRIIARSSIPLNKSYAQLTTQQKQQVRALYPDLSKTMTPPFPRAGLKVISESLLYGGKGVGLLSLIAKVDDSGQVNEVTILQSPNRQTSNYAKHLLSNIKFDPATNNDLPVASDFRYKILFN